MIIFTLVLLAQVVVSAVAVLIFALALTPSTSPGASTPRPSGPIEDWIFKNTPSIRKEHL